LVPAALSSSQSASPLIAECVLVAAATFLMLVFITAAVLRRSPRRTVGVGLSYRRQHGHCQQDSDPGR